jgi:hypothetical protein
MRYLRVLALIGIGLFCASYANAQRVEVGVGVGPAYIGPAPVCPYGYYSYYPYTCAPYGYYGPEWFADGVFIGAGPWFHGYYGRPYGYFGRGYYGRGYYGRGFYGRGYYGHGFNGRGYYGRRGFEGGHGFRGGYGDGFHGGEGFHGGGHGGGRR